jgi:hypothetical protein
MSALFITYLFIKLFLRADKEKNGAQNTSESFCITGVHKNLRLNEKAQNKVALQWFGPTVKQSLAMSPM